MEQERDRLKHLLIILLEALSTGGEQQSARARVQEKAAEAGIDVEDVHGLLDWIEDEWQLRDPGAWNPDPLPETPGAESVRVYVDLEQDSLTPEALTWLLELRRGGQINAAQLEALLHYTTLLGGEPLEKLDLEMVLEQVLFRPQRPDMIGGASEGQYDIH
ncbi:MAG: DUF494 domain-containing protein [bacterium]|nr:DUF494 domain-containing protein [bacterium]